MPKQVVLRVVRPPCFEHLSLAEWRNLLNSAVKRDERELSRKRRRKGKGALGVQKVLEQDSFAATETSARRGSLRPRLACGNNWRRIEAFRRDANWLAAYRAALAELVAGDRDALFPSGTYKLRRLGIGCCAVV